MQIPKADWVSMVVVDQGADAADDWIADQAESGDIVVTADIPLAARSLAKQALVVDSRGKQFTEDSIGSALASRELMDQLRVDGLATGGPAPFQPKDRSNFLQTLDRLVQKIRRQYPV